MVSGCLRILELPPENQVSQVRGSLLGAFLRPANLHPVWKTQRKLSCTKRIARLRMKGSVFPYESQLHVGVECLRARRYESFRVHSAMCQSFLLSSSRSYNGAEDGAHSRATASSTPRNKIQYFLEGLSALVASKHARRTSGLVRDKTTPASLTWHSAGVVSPNLSEWCFKAFLFGRRTSHGSKSAGSTRPCKITSHTC